MKKLFLFAALIMTGFAFYSCEDVVDNPAKDPAQSWNYSVSVKFENFDFTAQPTDPVTGETNVYKVPTTLYVLNEENTLMGTITTDAAPTAGNYGTYAGTLTGTIGNNLIITTKIGNDLAKQDGTLASAIENGIVQTAEVPIKIYNANSGNLTTGAAKMENTAAIAHVSSWQIKGGDKIAFVAGDQTFEWTVYEEFNTPATSQNLYIALPTPADPETEFTISTDSKDGYTRGVAIKLSDWPALAKGKVSTYLGYIPFIETGVDLTKWDAYMRENGNTGYFTFNQRVDDGKSFIISQSGTTALDSVDVMIGASPETEVSITLKDIRLGKNRTLSLGNTDWWYKWDGTYDYYGWSGKVNVNLIGENKFDKLSLHCPNTVKGEGSWKFNRIEIGNYGHKSSQDWNFVKEGAVTYKIDNDMNLQGINANGGIININTDMGLEYMYLYGEGEINIADGKKVNIISKEGYIIDINEAKLTLGKGSILNAETSAKDSYVAYSRNSNINVGENAEFNVQGGKSGTALYIYNDFDATPGKSYSFNIGKNAKVKLVGGPEGVLGYGMQINNYYNVTTNITLDEGATLNAVGIDRVGIRVYEYDYSSENYAGAVKFKAAKNAKIVAEDTEAGQGFSINLGTDYLKFDFEGEGSFEAKSKDGLAMNLNNYNGAINFKGGSIAAISGADKPAVECRKKFTIAPEIKSFKATKGTNATLFISKNGDETLLEDLVADKTKFNDATADGTRTITPKPAAE